MKKQIIYSQSDNYEDFISRHRHLRQAQLGYTPAVFPFGYEFEERESEAWNSTTGGPLFFIFIVDKGINTFTIEGEEYRLEPGKLLIIPQEYGFTSRSSGYIVRHVFEYQGELLKNIEISLGLDQPVLLDMKEDEDILEAIRTIGPMLDTDNAAVFCQLMGKAYEILVRLAYRIQKKTRGKNAIKQIMNALETGGTDKDNMDRLIRKLGISRSSINRMVNKNFGMSPKKFCMTERMKKAIHFLEYTEMSLKEIAFNLGYCTPFHFSSDFKRKTGMSPRNYRLHIKNMPYQKRR